MINSQNASQFKFYTSSEYRAKLLELVGQTQVGSRILLTTMGYRPDEPAVANIMQALKAAAGRSVKTTLLVDAHTFLVKTNTLGIAPGPLWYTKRLPSRLRQPYEYRWQSLRQLSEQPTGDCGIINPPTKRFKLPIAGRSHIKLAIVGQTIFLGGCNLQGTQLIDLMVGFSDQALSDWLYSLFKKVQGDKQVWRTLGGRDISRPIDDDTSLLIDAGNRKQSVILKSAIELIDAAQEWVLITCQFFPNSLTALALRRAYRRGVKVEIIFSHPSMHGRFGSTAHRANMWRERLRLPPHFFDGMIAKEDTMVHAKLLATDAGTIVGSHNYVSAGVYLGTAEMALFSRNPNFTSQALAAFTRARTS
jgi:phosphatidylserine/phosphatidylglycerophosphate/cardiolipin synthase-like enzyme